MRVPRKLSPSLTSVPLSSPPLPALPPPPAAVFISPSLLLPAAQSAHRDSETPTPARDPDSRDRDPVPTRPQACHRKSQVKNNNKTCPFHHLQTLPPILGPNPLPPLPLPGGGVILFHSPSVQLSTPHPPSLSISPPSLPFLLPISPRPLANNMERGQVERVREVQEWPSISQVLQG